MSSATARAARRLALWLACLAMLMSVLAPTVSRWLAAGNAQIRADVCSTDGARSLPVWLGSSAAPDDRDASHPQHDQHAGLDHCGYCVNPATGHSLPPGDISFAIFSPGSHVLPRLFLQASHPLRVWRAANPRAPPLSA